MKNENLIHIRLGYEEALQSKTDILSSEMNLIKIMKTIREYRFLRLKELKTKSKLNLRIKEVITGIKKVQKTLPELKIPEILQKEKMLESSGEPEIKETSYNKDLEFQLRNIQEKLNALQRE